MTLTKAITNSSLECSLQSSSSLRKSKDVIQVKGPSGETLEISFQRTIRVPDGKGDSELPPSMGSFPLYSVAQYKNKLPKTMALKGGLFLPMYQREAMWINFESCYRFAIKIHVGGVNAISGEPMMENPATRLRRLNRLAKQQSVQDYIVTPDQLWLDGIASQDGCVRQFVAMPLGSGYSVEAQVTGKDFVGGLQFEITPAEYEPAILPPLPFKCKPPPGAEFPAKQLFAKTVTGKTMTLNGLSLFTTVDNFKEMIECKEGYPPDELRLIYSGKQLDDGRALTEYGIPNQATIHCVFRLRGGGGSPPEDWELGVAPGGLIKQCILKDKKPPSIWECHRTICFNVQILNSTLFRQVTGVGPPPTPVCAKTYAAHGFPFFKIYKEESTIKGDFEGIKSVKELDKAKFQGSKGNAAGKDSLMTDDDENTSSSDSETDAEDEGEEMSAYPEPPLKNPTILLNPDGAAMEFRPVSELEEELLSMNAVQF